MDKNLSKVLMGAGIAFLVGGVAGAGLTYRDITTENLMHATMANVRVPFADTAASASARFLPYREGVYTLYLSSAGPDLSQGRDDARCGADSLIASFLNYGGLVDILITDPGDRVALGRSLSAPAAPPEDNGWIPVDTLRISPGEHQWTLGVYVCPDGSPPPRCGMEFFLLPPQRYEIGTYLAGGVMRMVGFGGLMLAGFLMIVFAGRAGR